ncbi:MAG: hypothetical protein ACLFP1_08985 [Candidatus Goldiibacteriota bacterium]
MLKGQVDDAAELNDAVRTAFNAGARKVDNRLKVSNITDKKSFFGILGNGFYLR